MFKLRRIWMPKGVYIRSKLHCERIRLSKLGNTFGSFPKPKGKASPRWKGEKASKHHKHEHLTRTYGKPTICENKHCLGRSPIIEWANISGEYKRDISDYFRLCRSCHKRWDMGLITIKGISKPQR